MGEPFLEKFPEKLDHRLLPEFALKKKSSNCHVMNIHNLRKNGVIFTEQVYFNGFMNKQNINEIPNFCFPNCEV